MTILSLLLYVPWEAIAGSALATAGLVAGWQTNKKNRQSQEKQNALDRQRQQDAYDQQRKDALADLEAYKDYNTPLQQMNRNRQAGISPHLSYLKGAENTVQMARGATPQASPMEAPKYNSDFVQPSLNQIQEGYTKFHQNKVMQAQTDNLTANNTLIHMDANLKEANTAKILQDTARSKFDLEQAQQMKDDLILKNKLVNDKLKADTEFTLSSNQRAAMQLAINQRNSTAQIKKIASDIVAQRIQNSRNQQEIENLKQIQKNLQSEGTIKKVEADLQSSGIQKTDPWYVRLLWQGLLDF